MEVEGVRVEPILLRATLESLAYCKPIEEEVASTRMSIIARLSTELQAVNAEESSAAAILKDGTPTLLISHQCGSILSSLSRLSSCSAQQASVTSTVAIGITTESRFEATSNHKKPYVELPRLSVLH